MKKTIITALVASALILSCNEIKHKHETNAASEVVQEHLEKEMEATSHSYNNDWINEIRLNNSSKWEANIETTQGVEKMLGLVKSSDPKTIEDYHILALKLNEEKNFLVKECTMKGPSHDNLHVFLYPLIEKIDVLLVVSSVNVGSKILTSIQKNLEAYYNYFQ